MPPSRKAAWLAMVLLAMPWAAGVRAERLPLRHYSSVDGLAGDYVIDIYRDSRGFMWFSTRDGLSRFDGAAFRSYGVADGLPASTINAVLETSDGTVWAATNGGGIARFQPDAQPRFVPVPVGDTPATNRVNALLEDAQGRLWIGTDDGVFVSGTDGAPAPVDVAFPADANRRSVTDIASDATGSLWFSGAFGLRRRLPDGRIIRYQFEPRSPRGASTALLMRRDRRMWIGFLDGLLAFTPAPAGDFSGLASPIDRTLERAATSSGNRWYSRAEGLPSDIISALHESSDGHLWVGTTGGLADEAGNRFQAYGEASGMRNAQVSDLAEDDAGNLWISTVAGVSRLVRHGLVSYSEADGLGHSRIHSIQDDPAGAVLVVSGDFRVNRFDGRRFDQVRMPVPRNATCEWMSPCGRIDRSGGWWMLATTGLAYWQAQTRLSGYNRPPTMVFSPAGDLPAGTVFSAFADSHGRMWTAGSLGGLSRWDWQARQWTVFDERAGLPVPGTLTSRVNAFAEDRDGRVWVGFEGGGLAREDDGRFQRFGEADGIPGSSVTALYVDHNGGLWFATSQAGIGRLANPAADHPAIQTFTVASGLSSDNVRTLVEDTAGRLYAGTSRGVDRLTPGTGAIARFTVSEGLASQFVTASFRDRAGTLWFGTMNGLSRLDPVGDAGADAERPAPPAFISGIRVSGVARPLPELGDPAPEAFDVPASNNRLEIDFFAVNYDSGALRYQYRLDGSGEDWSEPGEQRSVIFPHLAPASYAFSVRAVEPDGTAGAQSARVTFTVLKPFYATWWFLGSSALLLVGVATAGYRIRVARLLGIERVRARIATDLHDDIGASLSQIAILAEVARTSGPAREREAVDTPLGRIADTSRSLMDAMSDIVWAINPEKDAVSDLVHRMRRFVEDTLGAADIDVRFMAPDGAQHLKLGADVKREVFLILKESVNNIAKHAHCRAVTIALTADRRQLTLDVADDGRGFDPSAGTDGNGVASMRRRVAALGGRLEITSAPGQGTRLHLRLDLTRERRRLLHQ